MDLRKDPRPGPSDHGGRGWADSFFSIEDPSDIDQEPAGPCGPPSQDNRRSSMSAPTGMLSTEALVAAVSSGAIDTVVVCFPDLYGRLVGKRYDAKNFLDQVVEHGTHACDYLLTVDMEMNPVEGYAFANWGKGYGDVHLVPDLGTLRLASWAERTAHVLCDVLDRDEQGLLPLAPRSLLKGAVARAARAGFSVQAASELEFYTFRDTYREASEKGWAGLAPVSTYIEDYHTLQTAREEDYIGALRRHLAASGVPVENSKGEWGLGQHELNVVYTDVLAMADRHVVYKQVARELADRMGRSVTFMAKIDEKQAGSSCHVHMSLWNEEGSAFPGKDELGPVRCSPVFRSFLAGWMENVPDVLVFLAPNPNSYKRFQAASWAPTRMAWSFDNRTTGFRVVGSGNALRIECRIPGADVNPYLVFAALLAAGLDGVERQLVPPPMFTGDAYASKEGADTPGSPAALVSDLAQATDRFEASAFARRAFGDEVVDHYTRFFRQEHAASARAVTDWERRRYFERI